MPGGKAGDWFFPEPEPGFGAREVHDWVAVYIHNYTALEGTEHREAFWPGMAVRNAFRLVEDLCARQPTLPSPPEEPSEPEGGFSLHLEIVALRRIRRWCDQIHSSDTSPGHGKSSHPPRQSRLTVNIQRSEISLDSHVYPVTPAQAAFVHALVEADGMWVSGKKLSSSSVQLEGVRLDRVRNRFPETLHPFIESSPGKGYRLRVEQLE